MYLDNSRELVGNTGCYGQLSLANSFTRRPGYV